MGSAGFYYAQVDEERQHMMKIVRFVNECGGHALIPGGAGNRLISINLWLIPLRRPSSRSRR